MKNPYLQLKGSPWPELAELGWHALENHRHGDLPRWLEAIETLPTGDGYIDLCRNAPSLGRLPNNVTGMHETLMQLHPWRKGPLELAGVKIDTE